MVAVDVVVLVAVALLAFLVAGLLRSNAELTRAMHHLGVDLSPDAPVSSGAVAGGGAGGAGGAVAGATTPVRLQPRPTPGRPDATAVADLAGTSPSGDALSIAVGGVRHDTLVAFLTSGCSTCRGIWEVLVRSAPDVPGGARLVVVTRGPEAESPAALAAMAGPHVPVVMSTGVWDAYDVPYAPYFVYVSGPGARVVGEGAAASWEAVRTMVANAIADGAAAHGTASSPDLGQRWAAAETQREERIDRDLAAAGILPGDPRLRPGSITQSSGTQSSGTQSSGTQSSGTQSSGTQAAVAGLGPPDDAGR